MQDYNFYREQFENYLLKYSLSGKPPSLYEPVDYIMSLNGKRFRPVLVLMAANCYGEISEPVLKTALGIEVFHNFTLVHDDIMDNAHLRRGGLTVHEKYDANRAILSGDVMLIKASSLINEASTATQMPDLMQLYLQTAREICEGQQYDMDFERKEIVELEDYLEMIRLKTAVLLGYSLFAGARLAGLSPEKSRALYDYGAKAGVAFQIWDDYLDVFGSFETGKQKAGDIYNKKETFLIIKLKKALTDEDEKEFSELWGKDISSNECERIIQLMKKYKIDKLADEFCRDTLNTATQQLKNSLQQSHVCQPLIDFTRQFIQRKK